MSILDALTVVFAWILLFAILIGGILLMATPAHGREFLKKAAIGALLFFMGRALMMSSCARLRPRSPEVSHGRPC